MPTKERRLRAKTNERVAEIGDLCRDWLRGANMGPLNIPHLCECGLALVPIPDRCQGGWAPTYCCPTCWPRETLAVLQRYLKWAEKEAARG